MAIFNSFLYVYQSLPEGNRWCLGMFPSKKAPEISGAKIWRRGFADGSYSTGRDGYAAEVPWGGDPMLVICWFCHVEMGRVCLTCWISGLTRLGGFGRWISWFQAICWSSRIDQNSFQPRKAQICLTRSHHGSISAGSIMWECLKIWKLPIPWLRTHGLRRTEWWSRTAMGFCNVCQSSMGFSQPNGVTLRRPIVRWPRSSAPPWTSNWNRWMARAMASGTPPGPTASYRTAAHALLSGATGGEGMGGGEGSLQTCGRWAVEPKKNIYIIYIYIYTQGNIRTSGELMGMTSSKLGVSWERERCPSSLAKDLWDAVRHHLGVSWGEPWGIPRRWGTPVKCWVQNPSAHRTSSN